MADSNSSCKNKSKRKRRSRANIKVHADQISENSDVEIQNEFDGISFNQNSDLDTQNPSDENLNEDEDDERVYTDAILVKMPQYTNEEDENEEPKLEENEDHNGEVLAQQQYLEGLHDKIESTSEENQELTSQMGNNIYEQHSFDPKPANKEKDIFNVRALSKDAKTYELEKFEKNLLIIFNQENVNGYEKPRHGTDKDVKALTTTFEKFGFEVTEHKDRTKVEIFRLMKKFSTQDFTNYGCVGVAVLTHGADQGLLRAKDYCYSEMEIIDYFKVHDKPTLVTKPKFLIIQACRGDKIIPGTPVNYPSKKRTELDASTAPYILPVEADMLIVHSSFHGTPSHRYAGHGSWFIQSLCKKINHLAAEMDFENIITEVKRDVAIEHKQETFNIITEEMEEYKQMPVLTSTLIRKLYFKRFGDSPPPSVSVADCATNNNSDTNEVYKFDLPATPLLVQSGPCSCFLQHFDYMTNCLRYYSEENLQDGTARSFLEVAEAFDERVNLNAKYKLAKAMCAHLIANAKDCHYYKFLYFYKH